MPAGRRHQELSWLLSQVTHRLDVRLSALLEPEGLTLAQWRVLIRLTARGRRLQQRLENDLHPAIGIVGEELDDAEVARLRQLLQRVLQRSQ